MYRSVACTRAVTVWRPGTVDYSQIKVHQPDGYRCDCSGYVSMCWGLPSSENTVTLVTEGWMYVIPTAALLPGDAVGHCGPGTYGDAGHVALVTAYDSATGRITVWEQGGGYGPTTRTFTRMPVGYLAYRYRDIQDGPVPPPVNIHQEDDMAYLAAQPDGKIALVLTGGAEPVWKHLDPTAFEFWRLAVGEPRPVSSLSSIGPEYSVVIEARWKRLEALFAKYGTGGGGLAEHSHELSAAIGGVLPPAE